MFAILIVNIFKEKITEGFVEPDHTKNKLLPFVAKNKKFCIFFRFN